MMVTEFVTGRVTRYDMKTQEKKVIGEDLTMGLDNIAINSKGQMFISSSHNGGIQELYEDGHTREIIPPGMLIPSGVAIMNSSAGEELAVADYMNVKIFDTKTSRQTRQIPTCFYPWLQEKGHEKEFAQMADIMYKYSYVLNVGLPITAVPSDDGNTIYISSWPSNCINVYDLKQKRTTRTIDGNRPIYVVPFGNDLIVSELETHSVVSISPDGKRQTLTDGMDYPCGIAKQGKNVWVADWVRGEIVQVIADGKALAKPRVAASGLEQPEGIAIAKDGSLLAVESKIGRLVKINPGNGEKIVLAENLKTGLTPKLIAAPSYYFSGVTVGSDGSIYVSCDKGREVVRVKELKN
jgi:sugar lactone lactonase YvrE